MCGSDLPMGQPLAPMERGTLASLRLDDGRVLDLTGTTVIGRNPTKAKLEPDEDHITVRSDQVSRQHCRIDVDGWTMSVVDCGSMNGTFTKTGPGATRARVPDGVAVELEPGCEIHIGDRSIVVLSPNAPESQSPPDPRSAE